MPTYTYRCKSCEQEFDQLQRIKDPLLKKCPSCGKETLIRLIGGGGGLVFKGSGFYKTDYTKSKTTSGSSSSSRPTSKETKTEKSSDSKSESKTETKSESKSDSSSGKKESSSGKASDSK